MFNFMFEKALRIILFGNFKIVQSTDRPLPVSFQNFFNKLVRSIENYSQDNIFGVKVK